MLQRVLCASQEIARGDDKKKKKQDKMERKRSSQAKSRQRKKHNQLYAGQQAPLQHAAVSHKREWNGGKQRTETK